MLKKKKGTVPEQVTSKIATSSIINHINDFRIIELVIIYSPCWQKLSSQKHQILLVSPNKGFKIFKSPCLNMNKINAG